MTAAASLIVEKRCTAACLLGAPERRRRCRCRRCSGALHGALAGADVTALIEGQRLHRLTDVEVLMSA